MELSVITDERFFCIEDLTCIEEYPNGDLLDVCFTAKAIDSLERALDFMYDGHQVDVCYNGEKVYSMVGNDFIAALDAIESEIREEWAPYMAS